MISIPKWMALLLMAGSIGVSKAEEPGAKQIAPGIWKLHFGEPDAHTPCQVRVAEMKGADAFSKLPVAKEPPFHLKLIRCKITQVRTVLSIPCGNKPGDFYGFGLDPDCFRQNGMIKRPQVCDSSEGDPMKKRGPGSSHAPVPLYFSTAGFGVYVDTARVAEFQMARLNYNSESGKISDKEKERDMLTLEGLYAQQSKGSDVMVDIPGARGIDVYVFAGPDVRTAVQRWNLFSGGGAVPPLWGCGVQLRTFNGGDAAYMNRICDDLRSKQIPCDMLGLEPKWQSRKYPCSFVWAPERFPDPAAFIAGLKGKGFKLNLWEHSYIDPAAPFYKEIQPFTGSVLAMGGLVLDPMKPEGVKIYQGHHEKEFIAKGVTGFKIDECDRATIKTAQGFSFPNLTDFPSGIDGEQMGQTYGYLLQKNMLVSFKKFNQRTFGSVRASGALAAPLPFVLYSDTYTLADYIRQSCNASFTGLLWSPEFREAANLREFQRRMAVVTFSHMFTLNPYYNALPLWENYKVSYGNKDPKPLPVEEQAQATVVLRHYGNLRMQFLPYLYSAYCEYGQTGMPPIRALVMDFPNDPKVRAIDDCYMFGPSLLVAPFLLEHKDGREVYLPAGTDWYDFTTGQRHQGGQTVKVGVVLDSEGIENIPMFVRANSLIPLAAPVPFVAESTVFQIRVRAFGEKPAPFCLYEDDGVSFDFEKGAQNRVSISANNGKASVSREGNFKVNRYQIAPDLIPTTGTASVAPSQPAPRSGVRFSSSNPLLQRVFDGIVAASRKNEDRMEDGRRVLVEGDIWRGIWLETQPMGGSMYGKFDLEIARNNLEVVIDGQLENGMLPHKTNLNGQQWNGAIGFNAVAQYGLDAYYLFKKDPIFLDKLERALTRYDAFLWKARDSNRNGVLEAFCTCDTGEDGQKFNRYQLNRDPEGNRFVESVSVMADSYANCEVLARIAAIRGDDAKRLEWQGKADALRKKTREYLWVEARNAAFDRDSKGEILPTLNQLNIRAMTQGLFSQEMADAFVKNHLMNPEEFFTPYPIPSTAINDPTFHNVEKATEYSTWSGPSMGLTLQRSVRALENYGHYVEIGLIGQKLLERIGREPVKFPVQFNPITGDAVEKAGSYGPMVLATMEYLSRMYGVYVDRDKVVWNGLPGSDLEYKQTWHDTEYRIVNNGKRLTGFINGEKKFEVPAGLRVETDYDGNVKAIIGISPSKVSGELLLGKNKIAGFVSEPNQSKKYEFEKPINK